MARAVRCGEGKKVRRDNKVRVGRDGEGSEGSEGRQG